jgi:hypothetical protein
MPEAHCNDGEGGGHANNSQPNVLALLRYTVRMDDAASNKGEAEQVYEPRWSTLHFDEGAEKQAERHIFGEVRMHPNFAFQASVTLCADRHLCMPSRSYDPHRQSDVYESEHRRVSWDDYRDHIFLPLNILSAIPQRACAESDHALAPPSSVMNSHLLMCRPQSE